MIQGELGRITVAQPKDCKGFARARYEIPLYSHQNSGRNKTDDDYVDALLGLMNVFGVTSKALTIDEEVAKEIQEKLEPSASPWDLIG